MLCGDTGTTHFILNMALFAPLGIGLGLAGVPVPRVLVIGAIASLSIETAQYFVIAGRDASIGDFLANSLGGALGACASRRSMLFPSRHRARRLVFVALAGWLAVAAVTEWALTPVLPATPYVLQWKSERVQFAYNHGRPLSSSLNGVAITPGPLPNRGRDGIALQATVAPSIPLVYLSDFVTVFGAENQEIVILAQQGRAMVFRARLRASDLRLRNPGIAIDGVFPGITRFLLRGPLYDTVPLDASTISFLGNAWTVDSTPISIAGEARHMRLSVTAMKRGEQLHASQALTPELGWSLLWPKDVTLGSARSHAISAFWIALLLMPLGYWSALAGWRTPVTLVTATAALTLGLAAIPITFGASPSEIPVWFGGAAGFVLACAAARARTGQEAARTVAPPRPAS